MLRVIIGFVFAFVLTCAFLARPAQAQVELDVVPGVTPPLPAGVSVPPPDLVYCYPDSGVCIVTTLDFMKYNYAINAAQTAIAQMQRDLAVLRAAAKVPPKCAEVSVTEPSKAPKVEIPPPSAPGGRS